ncbi:MAG TPA: hypothetical protein VIJ50_12350 [Solirubrobacteraceae bacterium]
MGTRRRRRGPIVAATVVLAFAFALSGLGAGEAFALPPTWGQASEILQPLNADPEGSFADLSLISCGASGSCAVVGTYLSTGRPNMGAVESGGVWGAATEIGLPANATPSLANYLESLACPPSGSCIAAGYYTASGSSAEEGMVVSETGGVWGQPAEIELPANASPTAQVVDLDGAACTSPGNCVLSGGYYDTANVAHAMLVTETNGTWGQGVAIAPPANVSHTDPASQPDNLDSLACSSAGSCVALGYYVTNTNEFSMMGVVETHGAWGPATAIALPANKSSQEDSLFGHTHMACHASGSCVAVGDYENTAGNREGFVVSESGGLWGAATPITLAVPTFDEGLESVACPPSGACVAVAADSVATEVDGAWPASTTQVEVALPADANEPPGGGQFFLSSIACPAAAACVAAGDYDGIDTGIRPMIVNETNGGPYSGAIAKTGPLLENTLSASVGGTAEFSGTITPGNLASGLEWWFQYGPVGTNFNATGCGESAKACPSGGPTETPRTALSATPGTCSGIATPEPCVSARNAFPLTGYTAYEYRLVVQEGQQPPIYGASLPFIPGNLINPNGFKPAGRYNLAIVCPAACQALLHADAQNASGPGLAFGQLAITQSTPAGGIGGAGEVLTVHNGKLPEQHGFIFKGNLLLSRISMDLSPIGGPATIATPFSLAGAVNYGHSALEPFTFAGNLTGGGYWEACRQETGAGSCSPPDHPDKNTAGTVSGAAGVASTTAGIAVGAGAVPGGQPVAVALGVFSAVTWAISLDPPDKHYKKITHPRRVKAIHVMPGHGLSKPAAAATSQLATALAQAGVAGNAFLAAWQRYQGASRTAEPVWLGRQYQATLQYGHEFVNDCRRAAGLLAAQHSELADSPLGRRHLSARRLRQLLRAVRRHGVSRSLALQLVRLGITTSVVKAAGGAVPTTPPAGAATPLGPVLDPAFAAKLNELANGLDEYLASLAQHPFS